MKFPTGATDLWRNTRRPATTLSSSSPAGISKNSRSEDKLGTQMRAVGEVMSIGKNYKEAFQKSIRSLEKKRYGLGFVKDFNTRSLDELMEMLSEPSSERQFIMYEALRKGASVDALSARTYIKKYFIEQMKELVGLEERMLQYRGKKLPDDLLIQAKKDGFADKYLAQILSRDEADIRKQRLGLGITEAWEAVPVSGVENAAYYFSTYNAPDTVPVTKNRKIMVLGGGPNRIWQGIEFDYCCVQRAFALRDEGIESNHGQLQSGNGFHRLRHVQQTLFRAADGGRCFKHLRKGKTGRRDCPVRRADAAQHCRSTG